MIWLKAVLLIWIVKYVYFIIAEVLPVALATAANLSEVDPRIIGGSAIQISQAPWQVSVRLKVFEQEKFGSGHICGGSVITQRLVVSAAHCVASTEYTPMIYRSASEFTLVMGDASLYYRTSNTQQYDVIQILPNPYFNYNTLVNDIALFFINGYIPWNSPTVQAIALNTLAVASGAECTVTGWGKTGQGYISQVLESATVPIVSKQTCSTNYDDIEAGMLCAGNMQNGGVDACQGDSGGPLSCNGTLVGIVSWGNGCALPGYPGVYTNVSYFDSWIVLTNSSLNYTYYINGDSANINLNAKMPILSIFCGLIVAFLFRI